ncbi:hypothetical protein SAMN05443543_103356 [Flavobacterium flevense]|uniref:Uncharacterized protein n=1 Tax=Flavobacterium flevense TaxID=983 RepID=A0A4Y4AY60_9FLAO|nr:hypothetical protein [Flavobacterium flevense]GEC72249.1 hypothetical protein FFL01_17880 [Flavobacterium flevense]SHL66995.1 hypothetical protein SAMN05443543_103356 [Flavobacterium flevense]
MKKVKLTNEELNYLDTLIIEINSKLGLIKNDESCEDGMDGGIRGLLFFIQATLTYPESEEFFTYDEGKIEALTYIASFSNEQIFFIIKILEDKEFKDENLSEDIIGKILKKFKKIQPKFIDA